MKVAIVTGGAQGIGLGIVEHLLNKGYAVAAFDANAKALKWCEKTFHKNQKFLALTCDVSKEAAVKKCVAKVLKTFGRIDALINNAGLATPETGPIEKLPLEIWNRYLAVNLTSAFLCTRECIPALRKTKGCIINVSSTRAHQCEPHTEAYSVTKSAMLGLTQSTAISLGPDIRVNTILPGWIDTSTWRENGKQEKITNKHRAQHPVGRLGSPKDIAVIVEFLLSPGASNITGAEFVSDGGMAKKMIYL